jgi:alpha-amylase
LGTYNQKDTVPTRYGTEAQLEACVQAFSAKGIDCIVDMVLNHMNNSDATYRYDYAYSSHRTFEKRTSGPADTNGYFNVNYTNYPFQYDHGFGLPSNVKAWSNYPTAHSADVNERNPYMRNGMKNNGSWLQGKVGYRGCRFDFSQGVAPWFFAEYMDYGMMKGRFAVAEYWAASKDASAREHQTWVSLMEDRVCSFDFPLHKKLADMCNENGTFDMESLASGALIHVNPARAVTFVESHDEIRPFGDDDGTKKGMLKGKELAYAFILMSEGHPCVFRQDYSDAPYADENPPSDPIDDGWTGSPLKSFIDPLIDARTNYAGGTTTYLSTANKTDLFIAKRNGTVTKDGCIFVINDNMTQTLTNTVNTGWAEGTVLVDVLQTNHTVTVQAGGMAPLSASNRFYRVYVRQ